MRTKQNLIQICLAVVLLLALPAATQAQYQYTINNGTITITGYTGAGGAVATRTRRRLHSEAGTHADGETCQFRLQKVATMLFLNIKRPVGRGFLQKVVVLVVTVVFTR